MKVSKTVFAGVGGAMLISSAASAAYTGLDIVSITDFTGLQNGANVQAAWDGLNLETYQIFATFDVESDLTAVVGTPGWNMFASGNIYNATGGGDIDLGPPGEFDTFGDPTVGFDSWYTIGDGENVLIDPILEPQAFADGWGTANGGFVTTPGGTGLGTSVLVFQISIEAGTELILQFNLNVQDIGLIQERVEINVAGEEGGEVPAPGALALLGVAGLVGSRRRRA